VTRLVDYRIPARYIAQTLARVEIHDDSKSGSRWAAPFLRDSVRTWRKSGRSLYQEAQEIA
jgi:hypothetical protein